jgi:hypothetical protein
MTVHLMPFDWFPSNDCPLSPAEVAELEAAVDAEFLAERFAELRAAKLAPTKTEQADLSRRLGEAINRHFHLPPEATVDPVVCRELEAMHALKESGSATWNTGTRAIRRVALASVWPDVLLGWQLENQTKLATRKELTALLEEGDKVASDHKAAMRLEHALRELSASNTGVPDLAPPPLALWGLPHVQRTPEEEEEGGWSLGGPGDWRWSARECFAEARRYLAKVGERDGMFALDADLADFIADVPNNFSPEAPSEEEKKEAALWLEESENWRKTWRIAWAQSSCSDECHPCRERWLDPLRLHRVLARVLWRLTVRPALAAEADQQRISRPLLAQGVFAGFLDGLTTAATAALELRETDRGWIVTNRQGNPFVEQAFLDRALAEAFLDDSRLLGGLDGLRVIRGLAEDIAAASAAAGAEVLSIDLAGGLEEGCRRWGLPPKQTPRLHAVLRAGQQWRKAWAGGEVGGLWTYLLEKEARRGQRSRLSLQVSPILGPRYLFRFANRLAVPIVEPPLVGSPRWHAAEYRLGLAVIARMVDQRQALTSNGGALLDWDKQARRVGLEPRALARVKDRWIQDGTDAPAFLERVGPDRYILADRPPTKAARDWLIECGARSRSNAAIGKAAAEGRKRRASGAFQAGKGRKRKG